MLVVTRGLSRIPRLRLVETYKAIMWRFSSNNNNQISILKVERFRQKTTQEGYIIRDIYAIEPRTQNPHYIKHNNPPQ